MKFFIITVSLFLIIGITAYQKHEVKLIQADIDSLNSRIETVNKEAKRRAELNQIIDSLSEDSKSQE